MLKPFIHVIIALLLTHSAIAQYRWDKLYNFCPDTIFSGYPFNAYADTDRVFVSGGTFDPSLPKVIPFVAAIDYSGQLLWKKYIYQDGVYDGYLGNGNAHSSLKSYAARRYVVAPMNEQDSIHPVFHSLFQPYLYFFDAQGDSVRKVYMADSSRSRFFHSLIVDTQSNIVALGWTSSKAYHPVGSSHKWDSNAVLVVKMDTLGNVLWEKKYQETFLANTPYIDVLNIELSADKLHYILFCNVPNAATGLVQNIIIKIDLNGNQVWKTWLPLQYYSSIEGQLISLRGGGYVFCSGYAKSPPLGAPIGNELYYGKLDEQGNVLWSKTYTSFVISIIIRFYIY